MLAFVSNYVLGKNVHLLDAENYYVFKCSIHYVGLAWDVSNKKASEVATLMNERDHVTWQEVLM